MKLIVIQADAALRIETPYGSRRSTVAAGTFAVPLELVAAYLERIPFRVRKLSREPTPAEIHRAERAGFIPASTEAPAVPPAPEEPPAAPEPPAGEPPATEEDPEGNAPFSLAVRRILSAVAKNLGIPYSGSRKVVWQRLQDYAGQHNISLEGSVNDVTARLMQTRSSRD